MNENFQKYGNEIGVNAPDLPDAACGMLSVPLVRGDYKFNLVTLEKDVSGLNLRHVEEELLALLDLIAEEAKVALHRLDERALLHAGGLDVYGKVALGRRHLEGDRVVQLKQLLLVAQAGDAEIVASLDFVCRKINKNQLRLCP
jgi:hypothetical protein